jgi:peptide/nickel transport system permease protein
MIANGTQNIVSGQWWISVFPGLAVATLVLGFHLIGDGLTELLQRARRS